MFRRAILAFVLALCPYFGLLCLLYDGRMELGRDLLTLWLIAQIVLCVPLSRLIIRFVVAANLREVRTFVASLREGGAPLFTSLPNQTEEEDDLLLLKRALNALSRVVTNYRVSAGECLSAAKQDMSRYRELAHVDQLTGVYNRRAFDEELTARIAWADRPDRVFYLLFLDLDDFKRVNDTHGHPVGDELLASMGSILRECTRGNDDFPFRYGGDEFGLILVGGTRDTIQRIAERIRSRFAKNAYGVAVSVGGAMFSRSAGGKKGTYGLCHRADEALYLAKQAKGVRGGDDSGVVLLDT
ncbi:GGDEF domain-containing protein [Desulfoplanes sp.]